MTLMLRPLARCAMISLAAVFSRTLLFPLWIGMAVAMLIPAVFTPKQVQKAEIIQLVYRKNAVGRYIQLKRLAYIAFAGSVAVVAPMLSLKLLICLAAGVTGGYTLQSHLSKADLSDGAAWGLVLWLCGFALMALIPVAGAVLLGFGATLTMGYIQRLNAYMDAMASYLLKTPVTNAGKFLEGVIGTIHFMLGLIGFMLFSSMRLLIVTLLCAIVSAMRFPLCKKHLDRLLKYDREPSKALEKQLTPYLTCQRKRRHLIWMMRAVVRLVVRGRVIGEENLPRENEHGIVYLCNHGYVQGTIFSRAWLDRKFRSWSISDLMEKEDAYRHIREFIVDPQKWIPRFLCDPVARMLVPAFAWLFDSLDSIPVYRNRLRKLMETFRETALALECGDAVMIYPENPDDPSLEAPGYITHGIGPFFTGFTMIGSIYHQRTGENVTYVPMYCSLNKHTLLIGKPIIASSEMDPNEEKERIVNKAREEMIELMQSIEELPQTLYI